MVSDLRCVLGACGRPERRGFTTPTEAATHHDDRSELAAAWKDLPPGIPCVCPQAEIDL